MGRGPITVAVVALTAITGAGARTAAQAATSHQLRRIALREARLHGDTGPQGGSYTTSTLAAATEVLDPADRTQFPPGVAPGDAESTVDVVVVHGSFVSHGLAPKGHPAPRHPLLALVIDARTGFVEVKVLVQRLPQPLSNLGPVKQLR